MLDVPNDTILAIAHDPIWQSQNYIDMVFESLKNNKKRSWFLEHAYHCLPLIIGNQYGFVVKSIYDFTVIWDGGDGVDSVKIEIVSDKEEYEKLYALQNINSHFGMGTFTIQMSYQLRTASGINLMTINPPNYFIDGIYHMTGVVETDNLRRDFTYNLRVTRKNYKIKINKGDYIGCVLPYPRHFVDKFQINNSQDMISQQRIDEERQCMEDFAYERSGKDLHKPNRNGKRYWRGEDIYGNKFKDHQTGLDK